MSAVWYDPEQSDRNLEKENLRSLRQTMENDRYAKAGHELARTALASGQAADVQASRDHYLGNTTAYHVEAAEEARLDGVPINLDPNQPPVESVRVVENGHNTSANPQ